MQLRGVGFDFGQTLAELDTAFLEQKLAALGAHAHAESLESAVPRAWVAYDDAIRSGLGGHPWRTLMKAILKEGGVRPTTAGPASSLDALVEALLDDQPARNLWRRPVAGMIDVVDALRARGVPVVVISNSEGGLSTLVEQMGWTGRFDAVADSGRLGVEKPDRAIFDWAAAQVGLASHELVHVGDSWAADVLGAIGAGATPVWFSAHESPDPRVRACRDAPSLRALLAAEGLLPEGGAHG
jgi:HAD superfamily hydrolase (TIGR01509 family)